DSDAPSLPSSISSIRSASSVHPPEQGSGGNLGHTSTATEAASGRDLQELDISVSFIEKGDFIFPKEPEEPADDSEEEYVLDAKAFLQLGPSCTNMEKYGEEEQVMGENEAEKPEEEDEEAVMETTRSGMHVKLRAEEAKDAELFVITKSRLQDLVQKAKSTCHSCGSRVHANIKSTRGSAAHVTWECPLGHETKWCSQEVINGSHVGDMKLASAVVLSGNNITKVCLMAQFADLSFISPSTFFALQRKYIAPAIENKWEDIQRETVEKHKGSGLVLCGDGRNDSPGHSAQYLTYTFMDHQTLDVIHIEFMDKREVSMKSPVMEAKAFVQGLVAIRQKGLEVAEVITDAHSSIAKHMRVNEPDVKHSWDVWHGAKNLGKKLTKVSARAATRGLVFWIRHVLLHFWFCARTCAGNVNMLKAKWHGLTHHVTNKHSWVSGMYGPAECEHAPHDPEKEQREEWLQPGSDSYRALVEVAYDSKFIEKLSYYSNFRHTSTWESFHNHILMYASKRYSFDYQAYRARNLLAVIDYMAHKDRPMKTDEQGNPKYVAVWSKHANNYVARPVKAPKTYPYIQGLIETILHRREVDQEPLFQKAVLLPQDPRHLRPRLAPYSPPPVKDILARRQGRMSESP
ncbi:uncharacterized protein, partial [Diadema antillarum]|uniref:uncharacterized protein n=1 Tax=Diadema antillarum TaxID=105358 RepID=UPI003A87F070